MNSTAQRSLRRASLALLLLSGVAGCRAGDRAVAITSPDAFLADDESQLRSDAFHLTVGDNVSIAADTTTSDQPVRFASADPSVVSVDQTGVVTAVGPGSARITVSRDAKRSHVQVYVSSVMKSVSRLILSPSHLSIAAGATARVTVQALDEAGIPIAGANIAFGSDSTQIATARVTTSRNRELNQIYVVTGVGPGSTRISASSDGVNADAQVVVTAPVIVVTHVTLSPASVALRTGETTRLTAQALDISGGPVAGASVSFVTDAAQVATVDQSGLVTAVGPGTALVTASSRGVSVSAQVVVTAMTATVSQVTLSPSSQSLAVGVTSTLTARALDHAGNPVDGAVIAFASNAAPVATVSQTGLVTAIAPGTAQITATSQGVSTVAQIVVTPRSVSQVTLSPASLSLTAGTTSRLTAQALDNSGIPVVGAVIVFASDATHVATVDQSGLVTAISPGAAVISASSGSGRATTTVNVQSPLPQGLAIDVNAGITFQTISGWEATAQIGETECSPTAYQSYRTSVLDRSVSEMGINRVRLEVLSSAEHTTDYFTQRQNGQISSSTYNASRYIPLNDNADPFSINAAGFKWSSIDSKIDEIVNPMRQRLTARGERLMIILNFVDFKSARTAFNQMDNPEEYAELIAATFQHTQQKYGWVPDAVELLLEPENTPWSATQIGRALVATANRLRGMGYNPDFIAPSTTDMANASTYWDQMRAVPGVTPLLTELAYHRYSGVSSGSLQAIGTRRTRDNVRTSMLEHIGSGIDDLFDDLIVGGVSAWQQYTLAFCSGSDDGSSYYVINQSSPANPTVTLSATAKLLSQVFRYVRAGAVRIAASSANGVAAAPVAFRNATGKFAVVVRTQAAQQLQIRGLPAGTYGVNYATAGAANVSAADIIVTAGGAASVSIPAAGAITIYGR